jgi:hypothetical protein
MEAGKAWIFLAFLVAVGSGVVWSAGGEGGSAVVVVLAVAMVDAGWWVGEARLGLPVDFDVAERERERGRH